MPGPITLRRAAARFIIKTASNRDEIHVVSKGKANASAEELKQDKKLGPWRLTQPFSRRVTRFDDSEQFSRK